jgi:hypothetical protein
MSARGSVGMQFAGGSVMMKLPLLALFPFAAACVNEPIASSPSTNRDVNVDVLFTHDGCTVYRFRDGSYYHYYVRCRGEPSVVTLSCRGKGCVDDDSIPTLSSAGP